MTPTFPLTVAASAGRGWSAVLSAAAVCCARRRRDRVTGRAGGPGWRAAALIAFAALVRWRGARC